jgi:hypothetical protein
MPANKQTIAGMARSYHSIQDNFAGGRPAASHFSCLAKKSNQKKEIVPGLPPLRGTLRCSAGQAAAELALRAQT